MTVRANGSNRTISNVFSSRELWRWHSKRGVDMALELSEAARELLLEAARDRGGLILRLSTRGGVAVLKTNDRLFGDGTPGDQARWENGVRQLVSLGLVEPQGHRVFSLTNDGYEAVRGLRGHRN